MAKYLVVDNNNENCTYVTGFTSLVDELLNRCKVWCEYPHYEGLPYKELFFKCLDAQDFGDICRVYKVKGNLWDDVKIAMYRIY